MRTMAALAVASELTVGRECFGRVTIRASDSRVRVRVLIMAVGALLVPTGRRALLLGMTCVALRDQVRTMRVMAIEAIGVPRVDFLFLRGVTRRAGCIEPRRSMRQASMTALAFLVAGVRLHLLHIAGVALPT